MMKTVCARLALFFVVLSILCVCDNAQAQNLVVNGGFETYAGATPKNYFINVVPTPWLITQAQGTSLAFICAPGTADTGYLNVYPGFPTSSGPGATGGNFLLSDADPQYSGVVYQSLPLLNPLQDYYVTFKQASAQQNLYTGPTTERWSVRLGGSAPQLSPLMSIPQGGFWPWHSVRMHFPAPHASNVLSFWAVGTPGGMPPIAFLDSVGVHVVPEPSSLLIVGIGLLGSVIAGRMRGQSSTV